ncbi:hypothetical protein EYF80_055250 [Liparis tanakae]|uniref:Uncharacterized protein n=1 Tax=Liparis tanakae TaxID=230148 RepID=A0A4Z2F048_9TELE|nr:hypothetical protein EYF80_055250 [Liparis tanakae]
MRRRSGSLYCSGCSSSSSSITSSGSSSSSSSSSSSCGSEESGCWTRAFVRAVMRGHGGGHFTEPARHQQGQLVQTPQTPQTPSRDQLSPPGLRGVGRNHTSRQTCSGCRRRLPGGKRAEPVDMEVKRALNSSARAAAALDFTIRARPLTRSVQTRRRSESENPSWRAASRTLSGNPLGTRDSAPLKNSSGGRSLPSDRAERTTSNMGSSSGEPDSRRADGFCWEN